MNNFTSELVDDLAGKLLIGLSKEENQMVLDEFAIIDENLAKVASIDGLSEVEPMTHCLDDFTFLLRDDVATPSVPINDLLRNSDRVEDREIEVPKVVG
jgi:aspartyl/glutamyl-tRNA(Asn/Gln) amidotransferase C subunit